MHNFKLLEARKKAGLTQAGLRKKAQVYFINAIETGRVNPTSEEKRLIAKALKKHVDEIFGESS